MEKKFHRLVKRQYKKAFDGAEITPEMDKFLTLVSESYTHYESAQELLHRSTEISSQELFETNTILSDENKKRKLTIGSLKSALSELNQLEYQEEDDILKVVDILKSEIELRRKAEIKIELKEKKYQAILDKLKMGMIETNPLGFIIQVHHAFCKMTGYTPDEILGLHMDNLVVGKNEVGTYDDGQVEYLLKTKSSQSLWVIQLKADLYDSYNKVIGNVWVFIDINSRKKVEEKAVEAQQNAESALESREMFFANMSHEIRTPMNGIIGMARVLMSTMLDQKQEKYLGIILSSAQDLVSIINDILDVSKISSTNFSLEITDFDLIEVLDDIGTLLKYKASEKGIYLNSKIDEGIWPAVLGDPLRLKQVLINLINNALKFTNEGGVELRVELIQDSKKSQTIKFSIEDTGVGIDPEKIDHIFESFAQEDESTSRLYGGTGLGLSIASQLVGAFGGELKVKSEKGKGAVFYFSLEFESRVISKVVSLNKLDKKDLSGARVLLVEDNEVNILLAKIVLENWNCLVDVSYNGEQAIEMVLSNDYSIILMDMQMPIMGGIEATRIIRENSCQVPIIGFTANALKGEKENCLQAGMNEYITKPFLPDDLYRKIQALLTVNEWG